MKFALRLALAAVLALACALPALAASQTYIVMPFKINGPQGNNYLQKALPSALSSRLNWPGHMQPTANKTSSTVPGSEADVKAAMQGTGAAYGVWGTVSVVGDNATMDVHVRDRAGKTWKRTSETSLANLMSAVQGTADSISRDIFKRPMPAAAPVVQGGRNSRDVNQMNPAIVVNETSPQNVYLNPQFRYQGAGSEDGSRLRSRTLPFAMVDFAVGDFNRDGKNEVAVLDNHTLYIFAWDNGKLKELTKKTVYMGNQNFMLRTIDLNHDGAPELVVVTFDEETNSPYSFIFTFAGGNLREYCKRVNYYLNVAKLPPTFAPTLIGQAWDSIQLFRSGVYIMNVSGEKPTPGTRVSLPPKANVFNFAWLPGTAANDGDKCIVMTDMERLKVFSSKFAEIHTTQDRYSGSSIGMDHYKSVAGLGVDKTYQLPDKYYAPMRMMAADLEGRGEWVLMMNKPISTAAEFFQRYRYYPQGEIHALYWDGVGMGLKWKTRRIKGSVTDIDLADINNDGVLDLVVGLNTHPGMVGVGSRRSVITAYPLDLGRSNPNTSPDMSEFEEVN